MLHPEQHSQTESAGAIFSLSEAVARDISFTQGELSTARKFGGVPTCACTCGCGPEAGTAAAAGISDCDAALALALLLPLRSRASAAPGSMARSRRRASALLSAKVRHTVRRICSSWPLNVRRELLLQASA